jgi:hypothetical protein
MKSRLDGNYPVPDPLRIDVPEIKVTANFIELVFGNTNLFCPYNFCLFQI